MDPKILPLSEIDFDSKEWDVDFFDCGDGTNDSTLLGLVGLAASEDGKNII